MREPIGQADAFAWWRAALERYPDGVPNWPQPGFYKTRLAKGSVFVPARIWLEQETGEDGELLDDVQVICEVNGERVDADDVWQWLAGHPITAQEFRYLSARNSWAENHSPEDYAARPRERIDRLRSPILF